MDPTTCTVTHWWPLIVYAAVAAGASIGVVTAAMFCMAGRDKGDKRWKQR